MNRRQFLQTAAAAAAVSVRAGVASGAGRDGRPNVIYILADDLGYGDLGCYGQKSIHTPNLDRMAAEGIRFTDHYAGSTVCAPSRATLMTGLHTGHLRTASQGQRFGPNETTVAEILKRAGYATGAVGKWGLGPAGTPGTPNKKGFDYWFGYLNQVHAHNYYPEWLWRNEAKVKLRNEVVRAKRKGRVMPFGGAATTRLDYSHDLFTREALQFVVRQKDRPFFLYLPYTIPHANNEARLLDRHGMEVPDYGMYRDRDWPDAQKGHAAMITRLDRDVGALLAKLKELGLDSRTLVMFSSDNGPHTEGGARPDFFDSNGPLRGIKRDLYEGGIRVPMIARWPGKVRPGSVSLHPSAFWDVLPTLCEAAGLERSKDIDGISFLPTLLGRPQREHEYLYWEYPSGGGKRAVRMGKWKAVQLGTRNPDASIQLFNLAEDLAEKHDVAGQHPDVVQRMAAVLASLRREGGPDAQSLAKRPPKPPLPHVHISDLKPLKAVSGHPPLGPPKPDRSIRGEPLRVAGERYAKGIGVHAPGELVYGIEERYARFVAVVGVDDARPGSVVFEVHVDGRRVCRTPLMRQGVVWHVDVPLPAGSRRIRLVVGDGGNGSAADHGDWVNAGFLLRP